VYFQLLQNEVDTEEIADDWQLLMKDCTSRCIRRNSHKNCGICDAVISQMKHCATASCDTNSCALCYRVVVLISQHYAECSRQLQQREPCYCQRYLDSSSNPSSTSSADFGMVSADRVRSYLLSVFPSVSDNAVAAAADDDDDEAYDQGDGDDKDFDSDSSDDSIMMPSFSSDISASQTSANETPGSSVPEGGAFGISDGLSGLCGRGVSSACSVASPVTADAMRSKKPVLKCRGVYMASEMSDPRLFVSVDAPPHTAGLPSEAIHSVPVTGASRPRGKMCYGTKSQLWQYARLWQNYADRARESGTLRDLPPGGVILHDFRNVSHLSVKFI